jgi:1-acyl-sn-glycerol-3-phosphate acyltransferase
MGVIRLAGTVAGLAVLTAAMAPVQILATRRNWPIAARIPWFWQRVARRFAGFRVRVEGTPAAPPLLIASNHTSWLDITILGSVVPVSFIAKAEVSRWPVVGTLARLQRTVFIDRNKRAQTISATEAIANRVGNGDIMVLFAEGTTGDGNRVLPFRSALLGAARTAAGTGAITVQPVAISYALVQGLPLGFAERWIVSWYGDMDLWPHLLRLCVRGAVDAVVSFGEPIHFGAEDDRKEVAEKCHAAVKRMVEDVRRRPFGTLKPRRPRLFSRPPKGGNEAATAVAEGEA